MNIKVNLQDGTPAKFKTELIDGAIVVTVVEEQEKEKKNLFPKWEELERIGGYWINYDSDFEFVSAKSTESCINSDIFTTEDLAKAALATARVSQTYKRYRELVGDITISTITWHDECASEADVIKSYGLLKMTFANSSDWEKFYESNKEDLKAILYAANNTQL